MALLDFLPAATALAGGFLGARYGERGRVNDELRQAIDDASEGLELAAQKRGRAEYHFKTEAAETTDAGKAAVAALSEELEKLARIRGRLLVRVPERDPLATHFVNSIFALDRALTELAAAARWQARYAERYDFEAGLELLDNARDAFEEHRGEFLQAAQRRNAPLSPWRRLLRVGRSRG